MTGVVRLLFTLIIVFSSGVLGDAYAQDARSKSGMTYRTWDPGHGAQVEYLAPNGRAYLWYPGNTVIVPSLWRTENVQGQERMCFRYPRRSYNPVTRQEGGGWECLPAAAWLGLMQERADGDIFGLSRRSAPPFALPKERLSLSELRKRAARAR